MTNTQRMKSDLATLDRREMTDKNLEEDRIRNDSLTGERRSKSDAIVRKERLRNDEMTVTRREEKDANHNMALALLTAWIVVILFMVI